MAAENIKINVESEKEEPDTDTEKMKQDESSVSENETESNSANDGSSDSGESEKTIEDELECAKKEADESYDRLLRVSAELENYKKRVSREKKELRKFANQAFSEDLLTVVDNLERAIESSKDEKATVKSLQDGIDLTLRELLKIFEKYNIKQIESVNKTFDPAFHQAVMREETDKHSENTVISEMQKGYLIHDRLLRPSMVVVAGPVQKDDDQKEESDHEKND